MSTLDIRLKPTTLARYDLPDILYPVSLANFDAALSSDGHLPFAPMLHQLQMRSSASGEDWQSFEPAMNRLAQLVAPDDLRPLLSATGEEWWLEVGPVDLCRPIVTIQRSDQLIAAMTATDRGCLRIAAYRPLDAKSASYLTGLAVKPHGEHGVCMRENNWEYALDCSAGSGNFYTFTRGEAHLSNWVDGIGMVSDGTQNAHWLAMSGLTSRPAAVVVAELGIAYSYAEA